MKTGRVNYDQQVERNALLLAGRIMAGNFGYILWYGVVRGR